jgi:hypothetical protein
VVNCRLSFFHFLFFFLPAARAAASGPASGTSSLGGGGATLAGPDWPPLGCWPTRPPRCWPRGCELPRWLAGSWPDSQSGGSTGLGCGGAGCTALAAGRGIDLTRITDSSLALLLAALAVSPPMMQAIIFMAATLVALEVRCTLSPAQMLVPSTVVSSCKGDSSGPKNSSMFRILASVVQSFPPVLPRR